MPYVPSGYAPLDLLFGVNETTNFGTVVADAANSTDAIETGCALKPAHWEIIKSFFVQACAVPYIEYKDCHPGFKACYYARDIFFLNTIMRELKNEAIQVGFCPSGAGGSGLGEKKLFYPAFVAFCQEIAITAGTFNYTCEELNRLKNFGDKEKAEWLFNALENPSGLHARAVALKKSGDALHPLLSTPQNEWRAGQLAVSFGAFFAMAPLVDYTRGYKIAAKFFTKHLNLRTPSPLRTQTERQLPELPRPYLIDKADVQDLPEYRAALELYKKYSSNPKSCINDALAEYSATLKLYQNGFYFPKNNLSAEEFESVRLFMQLLCLSFPGYDYTMLGGNFFRAVQLLEGVWLTVEMDLAHLIEQYSLQKVSPLSWLNQAKSIFNAQEAWKNLASICTQFV